MSFEEHHAQQLRAARDHRNKPIDEAVAKALEAQSEKVGTSYTPEQIEAIKAEARAEGLKVSADLVRLRAARCRERRILNEAARLDKLADEIENAKD